VWPDICSRFPFSGQINVCCTFSQNYSYTPAFDGRVWSKNVSLSHNWYAHLSSKQLEIKYFEGRLLEGVKSAPLIRASSHSCLFKSISGFRETDSTGESYSAWRYHGIDVRLHHLASNPQSDMHNEIRLHYLWLVFLLRLWNKFSRSNVTAVLQRISILLTSKPCVDLVKLYI